jgi:hypothetical protein
MRGTKIGTKVQRFRTGHSGSYTKMEEQEALVADAFDIRHAKQRSVVIFLITRIVLN